MTNKGEIVFLHTLDEFSSHFEDILNKIPKWGIDPSIEGFRLFFTNEYGHAWMVLISPKQLILTSCGVEFNEFTINNPNYKRLDKKTEKEYIKIDTFELKPDENHFLNFAIYLASKMASELGNKKWSAYNGSNITYSKNVIFWRPNLSSKEPPAWTLDGQYYLEFVDEQWIAKIEEEEAKLVITSSRNDWTNELVLDVDDAPFSNRIDEVFGFIDNRNYLIWLWLDKIYSFLCHHNYMKNLKNR
ncbi:MAG: hypothetical protein ACFFDW_13945 [Candidatus Thorarchaeota archaeon]